MLLTNEQRFCLANTRYDHRYSIEEAALAMGVARERVEEMVRASGVSATARWAPGAGVKVLPYPGGRHPRIGFLEGAVNPERGTKASVFAPWDEHGYVVVDVPEAIFSNLGLLFLAHTHVDTIWTKKGVTIPPVDWTRQADGSMTHERTLPNGVAFGARVAPRVDGADMELWLRNGFREPLTGLRTQVCVMLKGLPGFDGQTNENKVFDAPVAYVKSESGDRYVLTAWDHCTRVWGNERCPCMHSDPAFEDCAPGALVRVRGRIVLCEVAEVEVVAGDLKRQFGGTG